MDKWFRISAALSHGEETGDGHQPLYWEKIDNASDDNFLNQSQYPVLPRPCRRTNTIMKLPRFLVTFKMYGDKAADQPSGTLPLANETINIFARLLDPFDYFDFVKDKPAIS